MYCPQKVFCVFVILVLVLCESTPIAVRRRVQRRRPALSPVRVRRVPHLIPEGTVKLVGGQSHSEGNVEVYHMGRWGSVCDDEWDLVDAHVVCRAIGFPLGAVMATNNAQFGRTRKLIWMDNVYCSGREQALADCPFDGWKTHDCTTSEAAGVVCKTAANQTIGGLAVVATAVRLASAVGNQSTGAEVRTDDEPMTRLTAPAITSNTKIRIFSKKDINIRLSGGRHEYEGRVEVKLYTEEDEWQLVCGDGWGLLEAMVVCRQLGLGYASHAVQSNVFGGNTSLVLSGVRCKGYEANLADCVMNALGTAHKCPTRHDIAGVVCTSELPDLVPDEREIESSAFLEDRMLLLLQCALEENCLSSSAYTIDRNRFGWQFETRRLLRFTARIANIGTADFRPFLPKHTWDWHACHRHYHSMEVFAHFDIINGEGRRVAEGHKASFCLEDNNCKDNSTAKYACANYGDQGISVGCVDTYLYSVDCQWIDITDLSPGVYQLKVSINPEFKVSELSFDNNAALCAFHYTSYSGRVFNCTLVRP